MQNNRAGSLTVEVYDGSSVVKVKNAAVKITGHHRPPGHFKKPVSLSASTGLWGVAKFKDIPLDVYKVEVSKEWYAPTIVKNASATIPGKDRVGHFVKPHNLVCINYPKTAPWMIIAMNELGQTEVTGKNANPRIMEYFKASSFWGEDDSGAQNAWCASFTSWVMNQNGYALPQNAFRAKSWINFGKAISKPIYGAIGVKSRAGGGHVAFVVGRSRDANLLYMLGGNQANEVNICAYDRNLWEKFVVPSNYDAKNDLLPVYNKNAGAAGRED